MPLTRAVPALLALLAMAQASSAHADAGEALFKRHCAVCHSSKPGEIRAGPSLYRIIGRKVGSTPAFPYSAAMKSSGATWTAATLDGFIAAPRKAVPKTNMAFPGLADPAQRAALVAYLAKLK